MKLHWKNENVAKMLIHDRILYPFIFRTGSLTQYIRQQCRGTFNITIKSESWQYPVLDEAEILHTRERELAFIRESWLKCDDTVLVYARTVIPQKTLTGKYKKLTTLGNRPLGEILFSEKTNYRSNMRYAEITSDCTIYNQVFDKSNINATLWARQSLFYIGNKPILIIEIFFPEIKQCIRD